MKTSLAEAVVQAQNVRVTVDDLIVELTDGRVVSVPLAWFPRLLHATPAQRNNWVLLADGEGIHWPAVDEDLSVAGLLRGTPAPGAPGPQQRRSNKRVQPAHRGGRARPKAVEARG
jgi:hypothetical protein